MVMGVDIAEVYVLRKMHKEKMMKKKEEEVKRPKTSTIIGSKKANRSSGCFLWFSNKLSRTKPIEDIKGSQKELNLDLIYK